MTEDAWLAMASKVARGIRALPVIKDHPEWWVLKIVDGFGAHVKNLEAMLVYHEHKILVLKEEGDASHVNQAYDRLVARCDKSWIRDAVDILRRSTSLTRGVIDQWQLIHVGLYAVRACSSEVWSASFKAVNLHPKFRLSFAEWCKKIDHFLQAGQTFHQPSSAHDVFALLPAFWRGMTAVDRRAAVDIIDEHHHGEFTVACLQDLHERAHVLLKDMQLLRVCYEVAKRHPDHLLVDRPKPNGIAECWWYPWWLNGYDVGLHAGQEVVPSKVVRVVPVTDGLHSFMLHPPGLKGVALFEHMIKRGARDVRKGQSHAPRACYDVSMNGFQAKMLNPTAQDLVMGEIMRTAGGDGATKKEAQRRLDAWGLVQAHSQFANDAPKLAKMKRQLQLAASLAEIARAATEKRLASTTTKEHNLSMTAPKAAARLKSLSSQEYGRLTKTEICAVARVYYASSIQVNAHKDALLVQLRALMVQHPHALDAVEAVSRDTTKRQRPVGNRRMTGSSKRRKHCSSVEADDSGADDDGDTSDSALSENEGDYAHDNNCAGDGDDGDEPSFFIDSGPACQKCGTQEEDNPENGQMLLCDHKDPQTKQVCNAGVVPC